MLVSAVILAVVLSAFSPMSLRCQDSPSGLANLWGRVKYFHPSLAYRQERDTDYGDPPRDMSFNTERR